MFGKWSEIIFSVGYYTSLWFFQATDTNIFIDAFFNKISRAQLKILKCLWNGPWNICKNFRKRSSIEIILYLTLALKLRKTIFDKIRKHDSRRMACGNREEERGQFEEEQESPGSLYTTIGPLSVASSWVQSSKSTGRKEKRNKKKKRERKEPAEEGEKKRRKTTNETTNDWTKKRKKERKNGRSVSIFFATRETRKKTRRNSSCYSQQGKSYRTAREGDLARSRWPDPGRAKKKSEGERAKWGEQNR